MDRALCVIARSSTVAMRLAPGRGDRRLLLSYSVQVPLAAEYGSLVFWMADAYAARLHVAGLAPALLAPAWDWVSTIDPDLTGRHVVSTTMDQLPEGRMFVKPALLKLVECPAGIWDSGDFRRAARRDGAGGSMRVQYTPQILRLDHEHRFVVRDGQVLTGSPYRVAGRAWHRSLVSGRSADALAFARTAVQALGEDCPPVCSLDVALDRDSGRWLIVEANPLWASGPYSCDPVRFVDAVEVANTTGTGRWAWTPEETQIDRARREEPVVAVSRDDATGYVEFHG
ncbi:ATP-grasp domain-containing protein [Kineococcus glutinatus]|uniref:ATP-grasp domain-containing protein n=1 Tax=Kineococcus glutinatus TaxID=1070872 RepID=UPI0031E97E84